MTKNSLNSKETTSFPLLPFLFPSQNKTEQAWLNNLLKQGKIRSIGPRVYTSLPSDQVESALRGGWTELVSHLFPHALLSHRSALDFRPTLEGEIFLTATTNRQICYPGLKLIFIRGPAPLKDDPNFVKFRVSSFARALLENLSSTKKTAYRSLSIHELETKLESILQIKGEKELNKIRDQARLVAQELKWESSFKKLETIIGALLGTRSSTNLQSLAAKARVIGRPYESVRIEKFDLIFSELMNTPLIELRESFQSFEHLRNKAFFEAYFSNYIEGTQFEIEAAEKIVFENQIPKNRPKDGHDILRTFQIVSDTNEMRKIPKTFEDFESFIQQRHYTLMQARPEVLPGRYKESPNRAGNTYFTPPELVQGTLEKGFDRYINLPSGLARAVFMMFLIAEVHPFVDGNGRIARIMMNAELFSQNLVTIIIPTVYREDYLLSLRALTRRNRAQPLIQLLMRAQKVSQLEFTTYPKILQYLEKHGWFMEPDEGKLVE